MPFALRLLCALMLLASQASVASAQSVFVFFSPQPNRAGDVSVLNALTRTAQELGTVVIDRSLRQQTKPTVRPLLGRAISAYQAFRYADSVAELDRAQEIARASGARGIEPSELSDIYLYRALAKQGLGRDVDAWEDFLSAARVAVDRHLDAVRFPPKAVETFSRAKAAVEQGGTTRLEFVAGPQCKRWIDARPVDTSVVSVARGAHYLRAECPGAPDFRAVSIATGDALRVVAKQAVVMPPEAKDVASLVASERAGFAVLVVVGTGRDSIVRVSAVDAKGQERVVRRVRLADGTARVVRAAREVRRAYEKELVPTPRPVTKTRPWYRSPWPWVGMAVGAAVATAIILPLALDSGSPSSFDVRPEGDVP